MKHSITQKICLFLSLLLLLNLCGCNRKHTSDPQLDSINTQYDSNVAIDENNVIQTAVYTASSEYYQAVEYGLNVDLWAGVAFDNSMYAITEDNKVIHLDDTSQEELYQADANTNLISISGNSNTLCVLQSTVANDLDEFSLCIMGTDGSSCDTLAVNAESVDLTSASDLKMDQSKNIYILTLEGICVLDSAGQFLGLYTPSGQVSHICAGADGNVYAVSFLDGGTCIEEIDIADKDDSNTYSFSGTDYQVINGFGEWLVLLHTDTSLLGFHAETQTLTELVNFQKSSITANNIKSVWESENGALFYFNLDSIYQLMQVEAVDVPETTNLTLGVWGGTNLEPIITKYQEKYPEVTITTRQYSLSDGMTQANLELAAGDGPDMMDLAWINYAAYASKGVLANLYDFMASDGLSAEDFISIDTLEKNNSLYVLPTCFTIDTWKGLTNNFGTQEGWTWDEYNTMQEGLNADQHMTSLKPEDFLSSNLSSLIQECVNMEQFTCDFTKLKDVLNAASECTFSGELYPSDLDEGIVMLEGAYISSVREYNDFICNGQYTLIGMPSQDGLCSASFTYSCLLGINATSNNQNAAWDLLHYAVCEYPYEDMVSLYGISAYRPFVEAEIDAMLDPSSSYAGSEITGSEEDGYTIDGTYYESGIISLEPQITTDVVSSFWEFIDNVSLYYAYDSEVSLIVMEEAAAFFNGDKSADDVIDVIENRVAIYLSEQQ